MTSMIDKSNKKVTYKIMTINTLLCILLLILESTTTVYLINSGEKNINELININIVLNTIINFIILVIGYILINIKKIEKHTGKFVPLLVLNLICIIFILRHQNILALILLTIPTMLSIIYTDKNITKINILLTILFTLICGSAILIKMTTVDYNFIFSFSTTITFVIIALHISSAITSQEFYKKQLLNISVKERDYFLKKASTDELTKLCNHATYVSKITDCISNKSNLILAILDIDHFKKVNDTYGHDAGNVVLKRLAKCLKELENEDTMVARYGGEEFVILFENTTKAQVAKIMNKLKDDVNKIKFADLNNTGITFSCGIAKRDRKDDAESLFNKADKELYYAKNNGRNRVIIYQKKEQQ